MAAQGQGEQMPNLPAPLGVHKGYMSPQPTIMIMKEKISLSGDDFTVKTTSGNPVLRVDGKAFSLSQQKQFFSPSNQHLFTLKHHHFSMFKSTYLESPQGDVIAELKGRASFGKAKIDVSFTNTCAEPARPVVLEVRGQWFDRSADILWDGQPVAKIRRDFFNAREFFAGGQTYGVEVAANVDLALIAAIVVGVDEQRNEGH